MVINLQIPNIRYEVDSLVRMFSGTEKVDIIEDGSSFDHTENFISIYEIESISDGLCCCVELSLEGNSVQKLDNAPFDIHEKEQLVCHLIYQCYESLGYSLPWGLLTGVRPVKLIKHLFLSGKGDEQVNQFLRDYYVSLEKIQLLMNTWNTQKDMVMNPKPKCASLYISIPFCPSRCSYCSFISQEVGMKDIILDSYLQALRNELFDAAKIFNDNGLTLTSIYIGGGTPSVLNQFQTNFLLDAVEQAFHFRGEYCIEAGRPETITLEKLESYQNYGVTRISINPQTLNDQVLSNIGRNHTASDFMKAYELSQSFHFIRNVDLIAGLPGDSMESFCRSFDFVLELHPENITIHTLTVKKSSFIKNQHIEYYSPNDMVEYAYRKLIANGYAPYYLYRQKNTIDSLENVGFSLSNKECYYNIKIMDDSESIIAVGAGAVTKYVPFDQSKIERVYNYKYPKEYLSDYNKTSKKNNLLWDKI